MRLTVKFGMRVYATKRGEYADVQRMNAEIDRDALRNVTARCVMDESLSKDFVRILSDLRQLMDRARARRQHRK